MLPLSGRYPRLLGHVLPLLFLQLVWSWGLDTDADGDGTFANGFTKALLSLSREPNSDTTDLWMTSIFKITRL